jgi:hypothetical protein
VHAELLLLTIFLALDEQNPAVENDAQRKSRGVITPAKGFAMKVLVKILHILVLHFVIRLGNAGIDASINAMVTLSVSS